ncbi:MAG: SRPBCC domain-containing protein, partial [Stellaceae bacterium]
ALQPVSADLKGKVLVWEPPRRLVLAWQIDAQWKFDPGLVTEVEVTFAPQPGAGTRVELEHRNLERFGERAEAVRTQVDGGWPGVLESFAKVCNERETSGGGERP